MSMREYTAQDVVARQLDAERTDLTRRLAAADKEAVRLQRVSDAAFRKAKSDKPADVDAYVRASRNAVRQLTQATTLRERLAALDDPAEKERRAHKEQRRRESREKLDTLHAEKTSKEDTVATKTKSTITPPSAATVKRIVDAINSGKGLTTVAKELNASKVPPPGRGQEWYAPDVRRTYMKATGAKGIKSVRKKAPLASRATKDTPPAATVKLGKATATPLTKQAQGAGTSRGGTGTRKSSKTAGAKRSTAKTKTTTAARAKRGSAKRGAARRK